MPIIAPSARHFSRPIRGLSYTPTGFWLRDIDRRGIKWVRTAAAMTVHAPQPGIPYHKYPHNRQGFVPRYMIVGQYLSRQLPELLAQNKRTKLITAVRDPIARGISSFFQNVNQYIPDFMQKFKAQRIAMEQIADAFWQEAGERRYRHNHWFDQEFKPVFGIDMFVLDFPKSKGYLIDDVAYQQFKTAIKFSPEYIDSMYDRNLRIISIATRKLPALS